MKIIQILITSLALSVVLFMVGCDSSEKKVADARDDVNDSRYDVVLVQRKME